MVSLNTGSMGSEEEQTKQRFFDIIKLLIVSTNNEERTMAEAELDSVAPEAKIYYHLWLLKNPAFQHETDVLAMSALLLRRLFMTTFDMAWPNLSQEARNAIRNDVTALVVTEGFSASLRKKYCELCAEFIRAQMDEETGENHWPEFLTCLFQMINGNSVILKENALIIFGDVPTIFGAKQAEYMDIIKQMLSSSLVSDAPTVRLEASTAVGSFILENAKEEAILKHFSDLVPAYFKVLQESITTDDDDTVLKAAIEIMNEAPKFFRQHLGEILGFCIQLGKNKDADGNGTDEDTINLAVEFCISACETLPGAVKKLGEQFIIVLVQWLLSMMSEVDFDCDAAEWAANEEPVEDDDSSPSAIAEAGLDRVACGLGGKFVLPVVMNQVQTLLASPNWQNRYAGLMAISCIGEGCEKTMEPYLPQIIDPIINFLKDPDPRVRYAACNALGQMATDFAPSYEKKYHSKVLPPLIMLLEDHSCARVQAHAGAALVNFCEECPRDILKNYAEVLVAKLETCFTHKLQELVQNHSKKLVVEQLITTVASIANTLESDFAQYYEKFMPCIKSIIQTGNVDGLQLLRGKSIECASLIGIAVGAEKFTADASEIMNLLLSTQVENSVIQIADDDPQLSYMITAWARICQILGENFAPYLPMVMGPVLKTASIKPDVQVLDEDDDSILRDDWEILKIGDDKSLGIHTARLEDKAMACQMLVCYARAMKSHFRPYVDEVVQIIVPLFKFVFLESVRSSAAEIVPILLTCLEGDPNAQLMLWNMVKSELISATEGETENDVKCEQLYALACCIEAVPKQALDHETILSLTKLVETTFEEHFERCNERLATKQDEDYDDVLEEQLHNEMEEDNYLLTKAADITHSFLKVLGRDYLGYMETKVIQYVYRLLEPGRHWQERQWAICVWDDLMEYTGPAAVKYQQGFLGAMLNGLSDSCAEVRQASAYGCGIMAQHAGQVFAETCKQAFPLLVRIITAPESRNEDNIGATENAISAAARIIKYTPNAVNVNEAIPMWLSWLPITDDKDEVASVYEFFCELLEANNPAALGNQGYENLPMIFKIIATVFYEKILSDDSPLLPRLCQIVKVVQTNPQLYQSCMAQLPPELQQTLHF